jgi:hypothetical protein
MLPVDAIVEALFDERFYQRILIDADAGMRGTRRGSSETKSSEGLPCQRTPEHVAGSA